MELSRELETTSRSKHKSSEAFCVCWEKHQADCDSVKKQSITATSNLKLS